MEIADVSVVFSVWCLSDQQSENAGVASSDAAGPVVLFEGRVFWKVVLICRGEVSYRL